MTRFPHTVIIGSNADSTYVNGEWITGTPNDLMSLDGRFEAKPNETVVGVDGSAIKIKGIVYMPPSVPLLQEGMALTVMDGVEERAKGTVKQFDRTRVNARAWL